MSNSIVHRPYFLAAKSSYAGYVAVIAKVRAIRLSTARRHGREELRDLANAARITCLRTSASMTREDKLRMASETGLTSAEGAARQGHEKTSG